MSFPRVACLFRHAVAITICASLALAQQPFLKISSTRTRLIGPVPTHSQSTLSPLSGSSAVCGEAALAYHSMAVPGGGTLQPGAFANPAVISNSGHIAFNALVNGSARNQGVFAADELGLRAIAIGCGGGGGSGVPGSGVGDPTPIGGTFSGFFSGTWGTPAISSANDVLFMADVAGGSAPRGTFLFRNATQSIEKVAAVGDASPYGGTLSAVGLGSVNANGEVVFLAWGNSASDEQILTWQNGVLAPVARVGDASPGGGAYALIGGEWFTYVDGTSVPTGNLPDINDAGTICFTANTNTGVSGVIVVRSGSSQWWVRTGDPTPAGGTFFGGWGAILNERDEIAFYTDFQPTPTSYSGGWFTGSPGNWRKAVEFFDVIDGGQCNGLAVSRNPMQPLDDNGNVVFWANVIYPNATEREWLVVSRPNGELVTLAGKGDPLVAISGGNVGAIDAWPSTNHFGEATLNCGTTGVPGIVSAHIVETTCPLVFNYCTASTTANGCSAQMAASGAASASATSGFIVRVDQLEGQRTAILFYGINGRLAQPWAAGSTSLLCVAAPRQRTGLHDTGGTVGSCDGTFDVDFNAYLSSHPTALGAPFVAGETFDTQAWFRDPTAVKTTNLYDALEFQLAP